MTPMIARRSLEEILEWSVRTVETADFSAARRWRENGGKVVGHFQVYFPEEIAHAAGVLPIKIRGAPIEASTAESRFGSYLCSILKTSLELALSKQLELDMFVSHPICDAARNLASVFERNFDYPCEILYLPQNANSSYARDYLAAEYERLLHTLEGIGGHKVSEDDLKKSITLYNENRALLRRLYELKRDKPWLLATDEAYSLVSLAGMLPKEEHNELLSTVLELVATRERKVKDRVRVVFEGGFCEQPPLDLLRTIDRSCYIVDDDLLIGLRWILDDISLDGAPLQQLAHAYLEQSSFSVVQHDLRKPKEKMLMDRAKAAKADAVILTAAKMCEPGLEDQVAYAQALEENGIPFFVSEFQENMTSFEHMELQLETFVENLLFD